jgi:hypothetical protein
MTTIPTLTIDKEGQSYGGAYWNEADVRFTLTDEGDLAVARAEDASGNVFDTVELNRDQAQRFVELVLDQAPSTGVPQLTIQPRWTLSDFTHHLELIDELDEIGAWLRFWLGHDEQWDPADTEWEY